jgi:DNA ligase-1
MNTLDLEIVGYEEGSGRLAGTLGAILVEYKNNVVRVGSGFSDELRREIWKDRIFWFGRICEIQYFEETTNQNGGISLRFPVFKDVRTDKFEADF